MFAFRPQRLPALAALAIVIALAAYGGMRLLRNMNAPEMAFTALGFGALGLYFVLGLFIYLRRAP